MKTARSYIRVSSAGQTRRAESEEGFSIEAQRGAASGKAAQLEAVVVQEYVDAAESGTSANRPALMQLLADLRREPTDYVIVHKLDRLARKRADDVQIVAELRATGAQLISVTENIDETPTGMLLHGIMASVAEFYSLNLATEVLKGMTQKAQNGGTPSRTPLGYLNVRHMGEGREVRTVEIDPDRGPLIQWAFVAYGTGGYSIRTLLDELHRRGLTSKPTPKRPPGPVPQSVLAALLRNSYYIGTVRYRGAEYQGKHEHLIDNPTFERVQAVLTAQAAAGEKTVRHHHYLKGTVWCAAARGSCSPTPRATAGRTPTSSAPAASAATAAPSASSPWET